MWIKRIETWFRNHARIRQACTLILNTKKWDAQRVFASVQYKEVADERTCLGGQGSGNADKDSNEEGNKEEDENVEEAESRPAGSSRLNIGLYQKALNNLFGTLSSEDLLKYEEMTNIWNLKGPTPEVQRKYVSICRPVGLS